MTRSPIMDTTTHDPIRADVERQLHAIVDLTIAVPLALASGVRSCLTRRIGAMCDRVGRPLRMVTSMLDLAGGGAATPGPGPGSPVTSVTPGGPVEAAGPVEVVARPSATTGPADLAIEEYESLAASQVVARLPSLTPAELGAVRRFELDHRGRRTVLGKIDQLLAAT